MKGVYMGKDEPIWIKALCKIEMLTNSKESCCGRLMTRNKLVKKLLKLLRYRGKKSDLHQRKGIIELICKLQ